MSTAENTVVDRVNLVFFKPDDLYVVRPPLTFFEGARRTALHGTWESFCKFLSCSTAGDPNRFPDPNLAKRARGAWVPGLYSGTHGHANLSNVFISTDLLVVDVDAGDPYAVAEVLANYKILVHSTYKHTPKTPRCRVVFRLATPCTSATAYNTGLKYIADLLNKQGFTAPAKDSTLGKLAFMPMHQPGVEPVFIANHGKPLDLARVVAAHERLHVEHDRTGLPPSVSKGKAYIEAAVRHAADAVGKARDGERHNVLFKEAASLARPELGLDEYTIHDALLAAARHADPDERPEEHERTIRDAVAKARAS